MSVTIEQPQPMAGRPRRIVPFAGVGTLGTALKLALMYIFTDLAGLHYMASYALSFLVIVIHNYTLNSRWTFKMEGNPASLVRYGAVSIISVVARASLVFLLTDIAGLWYLLSTAIAIAVGFSANYALSLRWVWGRPANPR